MGLFRAIKKRSAEKEYQKGMQCVADQNYPQAQEHLTKALGMADHPEAAYHLARLRLDGKLNFPEHVVQDLYRIAADQGHPESCYQVGLKNIASGTITIRKSGAEYLEKAANQGHLAAQLRLAEEYYEGRTLITDEEKALKYATLAAEQGSAEGQYRLGRFLCFGCAGKCDKQAGVQWLRKAADQNHVDAIFQLGEGYQYGYLGLSKKRKKALEYWHKAAALDCAPAMAYIGDYYLEQNDTETAIQWYRDADEKGSPHAEEALRKLNLSTKSDRAHQARWDAIKADQNLAEAESAADPNHAFTTGQRHKKDGDMDAAQRWFRAAAEHGHAKAQYEVAQYYLNDKYLVGAEEWLRKSAENGFAPAAYDLATLLNKHEIPDSFQVATWADTALNLGFTQAKPLANRLHAAFQKMESCYQTALAKRPPDTVFDIDASQQFARCIINLDDDKGFAIGLAEAAALHPELNHDDWALIRGALLARINLTGYQYGRERRGKYFIHADRIPTATQFVRLDLDRMPLTKSERTSLEHKLLRAEANNITALQSLADFYATKEINLDDELLKTVGAIFNWRICDRYRMIYEEKYAGHWKWYDEDVDRQFKEDALKLLKAWHDAAIPLRAFSNICYIGIETHMIPYFCSLVDTSQGIHPSNSDALRYLQVAKQAGYDVDARLERRKREESEILWEMGRTAREERYAAQKEAEEYEKRKAARAKALDEKLDDWERTMNRDGLTNEEQHFLGKRDLFDNMKDETLRKTLHDLLD